MTTNRWCSYSVAVSMVLLPAGYAFGQAAERAARTETQANLVTLPTVAEVVSPGATLSFDAQTDEKRGSVAAAFDIGDGDFTFSVTVSGPLDDDSKEATPISFTGLSNASTAKFGLHWFHWPGQGGPPICMEFTGQVDCDDSDITDPAKRQEFLRRRGALRNVYLFNVNGEVGRSSFKFVQPANYAAGSEVHTVHAFGASVGRYSPMTGYITVGYQRQLTWEAAGGATNLCLPTGVGGALACRNTVVGAPGDSVLQLGSLEWRKFFPGGRAAISPSLTRDFENGVTAVRLPLYFFATAKGELAGGGRLDWQSDTEDWVFSIFVGSVLSIF